jgi:Zn finger protein HypA/HybF involved in hydrogenase expression
MSDFRCPHCKRKLKRFDVVIRETNTYKGELVGDTLMLDDGRIETIHPDLVRIDCPHCRNKLDIQVGAWAWR